MMICVQLATPELTLGLQKTKKRIWAGEKARKAGATRDDTMATDGDQYTRIRDACDNPFGCKQAPTQQQKENDVWDYRDIRQMQGRMATNRISD